jgi:photosystem II stability/assembly factor-like uncharacterized protein
MTPNAQLSAPSARRQRLAETHYLRNLVILILLVVKLPAHAQNAWELVSPKLPNVSMEAVRGTASGLVLAAGQSGVVLRSVDSGATWQSVQTGTTKWLYGLGISATDRCIAVGEGGTILTSWDGGVTWTQRESDTIATLLAVDWLTDSIAITGGQSGVLLKTTDAGVSWALLPSGTAEQFESIQFLTDSIGFAAGGGVVFSTGDAGTTWIPHPVSPTDWSWCATLGRFASVRLGFMTSCEGSIWRTTDGGNSWAKVARLSTYLTGVFCIDTNTAILVGQDGIHRVTHAGDSVTTVYSLPESWLLDVSFVTPTRGFAVGRQGKVLRTTDAGLTWGDATGEFRSDITDVSFWSESGGLVVGGESNAYYTFDGGRTWTLKPTPTAFNNIWFVDSLQGFATGLRTEVYPGVFGRTSDGGVTWEPLIGDFSCTTFRGIGFWDSLQGCVIGDYYCGHGVYGLAPYFTRDGAGTWERASITLSESGAYPYMYSLSIVDSLTGYALNSYTGYLTGERSWQLVRTTDAGQTWTSQHNNLPPSSAVHFFSRTIGTIVGNAGVIIRSEDAGLSWSPQESPTSQDLASVCFGTPSAGVAVGASGTVISTADRGKHWQNEPTLTSANLSKVLVTPNGNVTAVGRSGTIIHGQFRIPPEPPPSQNGVFAFLLQNYPNPFYPSTTIRFALDHTAFVTLKVFDLLGRQVATLVQEELGAGNYERSFDGTGLPSGVYFCRLQAGNLSTTRELLLLK